MNINRFKEFPVDTDYETARLLKISNEETLRGLEAFSLMSDGYSHVEHLLHPEGTPLVLREKLSSAMRAIQRTEGVISQVIPFNTGEVEMLSHAMLAREDFGDSFMLGLHIRDPRFRERVIFESGLMVGFLDDFSKSGGTYNPALRNSFNSILNEVSQLERR